MIEEIETLEAKSRGHIINWSVTVCEDYVTNLWSNDLVAPAIINGSECTWNRKYSIKSYEAAIERLMKAKFVNSY